MSYFWVGLKKKYDLIPSNRFHSVYIFIFSVLRTIHIDFRANTYEYTTSVSWTGAINNFTPQVHIVVLRHNNGCKFSRAKKKLETKVNTRSNIIDVYEIRGSAVITLT